MSSIDIALLLSSVPLIVENIFKYLSRMDLDSCSTVCELWKNMAETKKSRRKDMVVFFQGLRCYIHHKIHSSSRECSLDPARDMEIEMSVRMKRFKLEPCFCLSFATNSLVNNFERLFPGFNYAPSTTGVAKQLKQADIRKRCYLKAVSETAVTQYLPQNCATTFCVASGIIGSQARSLPLEIEEGYAISGFMIRSIPGAEVYNFAIDGKDYDISKKIPEVTNIKCLLVFVTPYDSSCYAKIIRNCLLREECSIAIGGSLIDRCDSQSGSVVAFCGERVEAASVVIKATCSGEFEIEKKLKCFENTGLLQDKCFAFIFASASRGFFMHKKYNLESSIFHRLYPNIPLLGVFGNGAIGVEFSPQTSPEENALRIEQLESCSKKYLHRSATTFVLVSIRELLY